MCIRCLSTKSTCGLTNMQKKLELDMCFKQKFQKIFPAFFIQHTHWANSILISSILALRHTCYPILAMVPHEIWQEDCRVYWDYSKYWYANLNWKLFDSRYWLFIFSLQSVVPFLVSVVLVPSSLYVTYVVSFAAGVSVAAAFLLPWWVPDD